MTAAADAAADAAAALAAPFDRVAALRRDWAAKPLLDRRDARPLSPVDLMALTASGMAARRAAADAAAADAAAARAAARATVGGGSEDEWAAFDAAVAVTLAAAVDAVATGAAGSLAAALSHDGTTPPLVDVAIDIASDGALLFWPALDASQAAAPRPSIDAHGRRTLDAGAAAARATSDGAGPRATLAPRRTAAAAPTSLAAGLDAWLVTLESDAAAHGASPPSAEFQEAAGAALAALARAAACAVDAVTSFTRVAATIQRDVEAAVKAFIEAHGGEPPLAAFDAELTRAASAAADADALPPTLSLTTLRLDGRPARQTLAAAVARWSHALTDALAGRVAARLANVDAWMVTAAATFADSTADADVEALLAEARPNVQVRRTPSVAGTPAGSRRPTIESAVAARRSSVAATAAATPRRPSLVDAAGSTSWRPSGTVGVGLRRPTGETAGSRRPTGEAGASSLFRPTTETTAPRSTTDVRRSTADRATAPPPSSPRPLQTASRRVHHRSPVRGHRVLARRGRTRGCC